MGAGFLVIGAIGVTILIRIAAGKMDRERIRSYVLSLGGKVISIHWSPFGTGWFGEKSDRIYSVRYQDRLGEMHSAECKTSLFSGGYFTQDRVTHLGVKLGQLDSVADDSETLEQENQRLRAELEKLRRQNVEG